MSEEDPGERVYVDRRRASPPPPEGLQVTWAKAGILLTVGVLIGGFIADVLRLEFKTGTNADQIAALTRRIEATEAAGASAHDSITRFELQIPAIGKYVTTTSPRATRQ